MPFSSSVSGNLQVVGGGGGARDVVRGGVRAAGSAERCVPAVGKACVKEGGVTPTDSTHCLLCSAAKSRCM